MTTPAAVIRRIQTVKARKAAEQRGLPVPAATAPTVPADPAAAPAVDAGPDTGFAGVPHRSRQAQATRWLVYAVLGLLLITGAWQLIGRPIYAAFHTTPPPPPPARVLDAAAVSRVAGGFTYGYLSYSGNAATGASTSTTSRWTASAVQGWTGNATLTPDQVFVGRVITDGPDRAIAQTSALVTPSGGAKPTWLDLAVVVARSDGALRVTSVTFDGDTPAAVHRPGEQIDSALSVATQGTAKDLLTALAAGKTSYISTPNVQLTGLAGAVQLADVPAWAVSQAGGNTRYVHATVLWGLTGTDLKVQQQLALRITNVDGRWLIDSTGPVLEG